MLTAGKILAILPSLLMMKVERLAMVLPGWAPKPGVFHAVYPTRRGMVPAVRRFLDFLGEYASSEGKPLTADPRSSI